MNFRRFPVALYTYVFGAAGLGFSAGLILDNPSSFTLVTTSVSSVLTITGYFLTRPYMREAKAAIKAHIDDLNAYRGDNGGDDDLNH